MTEMANLRPCSESQDTEYIFSATDTGRYREILTHPYAEYASLKQQSLPFAVLRSVVGLVTFLRAKK